jgi:hypothetical protein
MRRSTKIAAIAVTTAAIAGVGTASAVPASASARCLPVRAQVLKSIRSGLHASVRPRLRSARAVKARRGLLERSARLLARGLLHLGQPPRQGHSYVGG